MTAWNWLMIAVAFEATWVIGLKFTEGWTKIGPSALVVLTYALGVVPLSLASRTLSPSVIYPIWVGGGIVIVSCVDLIFLSGSASPAKIVCILLILFGVVGLKVLQGGH